MPDLDSLVAGCSGRQFADGAGGARREYCDTGDTVVVEAMDDVVEGALVAEIRLRLTAMSPLPPAPRVEAAMRIVLVANVFGTSRRAEWTLSVIID